MGERLDLHSILIAVLGNPNVYFQPPSSITIQYPCIVYSLGEVDTRYANNNPYNITKGYTLNIIDKDPDTTIPWRIANLPKCSFSTSFVKNNLNHYVFKINF